MSNPMEPARQESLEEWDDYEGLSEDFVSKLKSDAPEGCLLCQLDDIDDE